jgi:NADH-quinone oxidoreductase subunit L
VLWAAGIAGALFTAIYIFRLVFLVFFGEHKTHVHGHLTWKVHLPLVVLAVLSIAGGWVEIPPVFGGSHRFSHFLEPAFAAPGAAHDGEHAEAGEENHEASEELLLMAIASLASIGGIGLAWMAFGRGPSTTAADRAAHVPGVSAGLAGFLMRGWDFDKLYDALVTKPFVGLARVGRGDVVDLLPRVIAYLVSGGNAVVRRTQVGRLRWYAAGIAAGAVIVLALVYLA